MGTVTPRGASPQLVAAVGTGRDAGPYATSVSRFPGEGDISFPPTYRYERGSRDSYMWQKFKPTGVSSRSLQLSCRTSPGERGWQAPMVPVPSPKGVREGGSSLFGVLGCFSGLGRGEPDLMGH